MVMKYVPHLIICYLQYFQWESHLMTYVCNPCLYLLCNKKGWGNLPHPFECLEEELTSISDLNCTDMRYSNCKVISVCTIIFSQFKYFIRCKFTFNIII